MHIWKPFLHNFSIIPVCVVSLYQLIYIYIYILDIYIYITYTLIDRDTS